MKRTEQGDCRYSKQAVTPSQIVDSLWRLDVCSQNIVSLRSCPTPTWQRQKHLHLPVDSVRDANWLWSGSKWWWWRRCPFLDNVYSFSQENIKQFIIKLTRVVNIVLWSPSAKKENNFFWQKTYGIFCSSRQAFFFFGCVCLRCGAAYSVESVLSITLQRQ